MAVGFSEAEVRLEGSRFFVLTTAHDGFNLTWLPSMKLGSSAGGTMCVPQVTSLARVVLGTLAASHPVLLLVPDWVHGQSLQNCVPTFTPWHASKEIWRNVRTCPLARHEAVKEPAGDGPGNPQLHDQSRDAFRCSKRFEHFQYEM